MLSYSQALKDLLHYAYRLRAAEAEIERLRAALREISEMEIVEFGLDCNKYQREVALAALNEQNAVNDLRVLSKNDPFCPSCGHNRDKSSVSSIDHGDFKSCQKCGATWTER